MPPTTRAGSRAARRIDQSGSPSDRTNIPTRSVAMRSPAQMRPEPDGCETSDDFDSQSFMNNSRANFRCSDGRALGLEKPLAEVAETVTLLERVKRALLDDQRVSKFRRLSVQVDSSESPADHLRQTSVREVRKISRTGPNGEWEDYLQRILEAFRKPVNLTITIGY